MKKDINICPATKFIVWLILGLIVCIIGISNVFADEITFKVYDYQVYYDNNGSSVSQVGQTYNYSFNAYVSNNITTSANSYGAGVVISSGIPIISGHAYSLSFYFEQTSNIALSSKNRIAIGSSVSNSASNYANANYNATMLTSKVINSTTLQFAFTANSSNQFIFIPWTTISTTTQTYVFTSYIINDLGYSSGVSQSDINNSLNSQTNILNQSITNSQNAIINNQDRNAQEIQDTINDNFQTCPDPIDFTTATGKAFDNNGNLVDNSSSTYSVNYIQLDSTKKLTLKNFGSTRVGTIIAYDSSYNYIDWWSVYDRTIDFTSVGAKYFKLSYTSSGELYLGTGECTNKLDEQTDAINDINDSINNDDVDSSSWSNFFNNFTTNTFGLTSIVTAPLNLIQSLTSTTCTDLQLPLPYLQNKYLTLPCMSTIYSQYFGTFFTLYQTITYGIIAYWVCVRIFNLVKDFKNPDHDEIEVVDL